MTITPNLVRLDPNNHSVIGDGGPGSQVVDGAIGVRVDNKDRGIMIKADPYLDFNEGKPNYGERVYIFLKVDQPEAINAVRIRLVRESDPWSGDPADGGGYGEWDVDMSGYTGGWLRVRVDPLNEHWDRQGPSYVGNEPRWGWVGVMFDMANVGGKGPNVWVYGADVGTGIKVHDIASPEIDWESLHAVDDYGMVQQVGPDQWELLGDIEFENIKFDSVGERIDMKDVSLRVGTGCDFRAFGHYVTSQGDGLIDFNDALFVSIDHSNFNDVVGDPFNGYSIRFADNSLHTVMNTSFTNCGRLIQQATQFNDVQIVPAPQPRVFDLIKAYRKYQDVTLDGASLLAQPEGEFEPFETLEDNVGDLYFVGAPVPFNKMFFEGDLFGGNSEPNWSYWTISGWMPLVVDGEKANQLHGEITFVAPPDWQKLDGLYQLRWEVVQGLFAIMPNPKHKFAFYTPVV